MSENNNPEADSANHQPTMAEVMAMMERNRCQAEQSQNRMMEQHTRLLEQIATGSPVPSEPSSGTTNGRSIARSRWTDFHKTRPPTFTVAPEPLAADDWIRDIERKLDTIQCTDQEKTLFASHQLQGQAAAWWINHQTFHPGREIPWQEFKDAFHKAHVPIGVLASKCREFLALKQRGLTVTEYLHQFNYLARYAPHEVDTEAKKMEKFSRGLQKSLKLHISALDFKDMSAMVNKLLISEEARTQLQEVRKRRAMQMTPQPSAPRKRMMTAPPVQYQQQPATNFNARPQHNMNQSATVQCYTCGGNHYQKDCPQKAIKCYHCGQPGHFKSLCPRKHMSAEAAKAQVRSQSQINKTPPTTQAKKGGMLRPREQPKFQQPGPSQGKINCVTINEAAETINDIAGTFLLHQHWSQLIQELPFQFSVRILRQKELHGKRN